MVVELLLLGDLLLNGLELFFLCALDILQLGGHLALLVLQVLGQVNERPASIFLPACFGDASTHAASVAHWSIGACIFSERDFQPVPHTTVKSSTAQ